MKQIEKELIKHIKYNWLQLYERSICTINKKFPDFLGLILLVTSIFILEIITNCQCAVAQLASPPLKKF